MANDAKSVDVDTLAINTIRTLAMDAVQQANSGHPGAPMGLAPVAFTLFQKVMRYDPADPTWDNRDRFVLSNGHASMLLYATLHLAGVKRAAGDSTPAVPLEDIKRFRQLGSLCPGHPESHLTSGVETTTGPLGQGFSNSVGMAIASKWLAAHFNKPGFTLFDFDVYAIGGDGCMMEGISSEAASLAAHLKLDNLCWLYDNNHITIEGKTSLAFSEDVAARFVAYGWHVTHLKDANDIGTLEKLLREFKTIKGKPSLIVVDSHIAWGAPKKQDTHGAHGEPLGEEEIKATKKFYGWPEDAKFLVPDGVYDLFSKGIGARGAKARAEWQKLYADYRKQFPELAAQLDCIDKRELPATWAKDIPAFPADAKGMATRESNGKVLNAVAKDVPWLIGGAADLAPSTKTLISGEASFAAESYGGRNFHFGIREHAMGGILNGMALSKVRPYGAGFLIFSDYGRGSLRLAALMGMPVIYVFTHDSIGVGEDGPTHQPVEHLASLRAMPGLVTIRPGDANEVIEAWKWIMPHNHQPVVLALSRQATPTVDRTKYASAAGLHKGAYVLADADGGRPDIILMATGTEVGLCVEVYEQLKSEGVKARVVSMPSWEIFEEYCSKNPGYRESVLPSAVTARVSVEMATTFGWERYTGVNGARIGMHTFGASAPIKDLLKHFGFTKDAVLAAARAQLKG
jgi:transketolase